MAGNFRFSEKKIAASLFGLDGQLFKNSKAFDAARQASQKILKYVSRLS